MPTCASCNKSFKFGGVKDNDDRYCTAQCRFNGFYPKFQVALDRAAATEPPLLPDPAFGAPSGVFPSEEAEASTVVEDYGKDLMVIGLGAGASLVVAVVVYFLVDLIGYAFHAQTIWFVIPIGAFLCGMAAGVGFLLALRLLNRLPTAGTFLAAGVVGALSYVLIYFLMWWLAEFQGVKVRDQVGFADFLQYVIEHQRIRAMRGPGEGVEVGKWGYPRFALNLVGFAVGVLAMVAIGGGKGYCPRCKRYFKNVGTQQRSSSDPEATAAALYPVIVRVLSGHIQEAVELHAIFGAPGRGYFTTTITVASCPGCGLHQATLTATVQGDREAQQVEGFVFQGATYQSIQLFT